MPGDDTPETVSLAPSSPARAWVERRLRGRAWAAAQNEDTPVRTQCPANRAAPNAHRARFDHEPALWLLGRGALRSRGHEQLCDAAGRARSGGYPGAATALATLPPRAACTPGGEPPVSAQTPRLLNAAQAATPDQLAAWLLPRTRSYVGGADRRRPRFCSGPGGAQSSSRGFMAGWATNRKSRRS